MDIDRDDRINRVVDNGLQLGLTVAGCFLDPFPLGDIRQESVTEEAAIGLDSRGGPPFKPCSPLVGCR